MSGGKWKTALVVSLVILFGSCSAIVLYFYQVFYLTERFLPGVEIASIPVSGLSRQEALNVLDNAAAGAAQCRAIFFHDNYIYEVKFLDLAVKLDSRHLVDEVWLKERERSFSSKLFNMDGAHIIAYPAKIVYKSEVITRMGHEWDAKLGKQAVDARLEMDPERGLIVVPDSPGTKVNLSETMAELPRYWGEMDELRIPIIMNEKQPRVKAQDLQGMGELSSFSTWFNTSEENRSHNLRLAAAGINGSIIEPGEVFSFNSKVGPRTYENGFSDAMVIVGDKFELGAGGGVCQVSTTLYNACLLAGLEIVERHNHNLAVSYVPLGRDATVYYGAQDFKFKNNTASPVYIRAYTVGGKLIMQVYGNTFFKQKIGLSSTVDQVIDFKEVYEVSKDLPPGKTRVDHAGIPGYSVRSYRSFYDSQGKLVRQEQIGRDYYRPLNKLIYTGPKVQNSANDIPDNKIEETVEPPSDEGQAPAEGETSTVNEGSTEPQL